MLTSLGPCLSLSHSQCHGVTLANPIRQAGYAYPTSHTGHVYIKSHVCHAYPTSYVGHAYPTSCDHTAALDGRTLPI